MRFEIKEKLIEKYNSVQVNDRLRKHEMLIEFREKTFFIPINLSWIL